MMAPINGTSASPVNLQANAAEKCVVDNNCVGRPLYIKGEPSSPLRGRPTEIYEAGAPTVRKHQQVILSCPLSTQWQTLG
jgi:hypothetical protein